MSLWTCCKCSFNCKFINAYRHTYDFEATLTLPGIAGIILTVGMAVDANVLIFERIKEELKTEKSIIHAFDSGYSKAKITVLDANITTLIAAIILFAFGSVQLKVLQLLWGLEF